MNVKYTIDERYFDWLCDLIGAGNSRDPEESYILLSEQLYKRAFDDSTPNDFNRSLDGKDLRKEFLDEFDLVIDQDWLDLDCSMLEMFIGLSRRVAYHTDWSLDATFMLLINNLELSKYTDSRFNDGVVEAVNFVIDTINYRTYEYNGQGGVFPLQDPPVDQRGVEIWDQMSAYLLENFEF